MLANTLDWRSLYYVASVILLSSPKLVVLDCPNMYVTFFWFESWDCYVAVTW